MRLKSHIWVSAYLRRLNGAFISAALVRRGDSDAGAIYIKVARLDGSCQVYAPLSAHLAEAHARERAPPRRRARVAAGLFSRRPRSRSGRLSCAPSRPRSGHLDPGGRDARGKAPARAERASAFLAFRPLGGHPVRGAARSGALPLLPSRNGATRNPLVIPEPA